MCGFHTHTDPLTYTDVRDAMVFFQTFHPTQQQKTHARLSAFGPSRTADDGNADFTWKAMRHTAEKARENVNIAFI